MAELDSLFSEHDDWLQALPSYQRDSIQALLPAGRTPEETAQLWLTTPGPSNTFPYRGDRFASVFYDKLLEEIEKLICDDPKYTEDRKRILQQAGATKTVILTVIATVIAPHIGV